jgi:hypothetical protein
VASDDLEAIYFGKFKAPSFTQSQQFNGGALPGDHCATKVSRHCRCTRCRTHRLFCAALIKGKTSAAGETSFNASGLQCRFRGLSALRLAMAKCGW